MKNVSHAQERNPALGLRTSALHAQTPVIGLGEDPKEFLRWLCEERSIDIERCVQVLKARKGKGPLALPRSARIGFYPACHFDWSFLARTDFNDPDGILLDTFVYSDYHVTREEFLARLQSQPAFSPTISDLRLVSYEDVTEQSLRDLQVTNDLPCQFDDHHHHWALAPWGIKAILNSRVNCMDRLVTLFYLATEGVATFYNAFARYALTPEVLCLKRCGAGFGFNWTHFGAWDGPLAEVVRVNRAKPKYIVSNELHGGWPWAHECQRFPDWDRYNEEKWGDQPILLATRPRARRARGVVARLNNLNQLELI